MQTHELGEVSEPFEKLGTPRFDTVAGAQDILDRAVIIFKITHCDDKGPQSAQHNCARHAIKKYSSRKYKTKRRPRNGEPRIKKSDKKTKYRRDNVIAQSVLDRFEKK